jgi:outer membrane receptor protein involved in Fe transport
VDYKDAPCLNVDKGISESEHIGRVNLSWKATDTAMLYATWSEGYRPGGINRNPFAGDYISDFLTNWEVGWKTEWLDNRLQFNGAVFLEQWDNFQISFQGANGITQVANGTSAEVQGLEAQIDWLATDKLRLSTSLAFYDTKLKDDYVSFLGDGTAEVLAPKGTSLPITANFKGNVVARYSFALGYFDAHLQGAASYQGSRSAILEVADNIDTGGDIPASTFLDLSFGIEKDTYSVELFVANATDEDSPLGKTSECTPQVCGVPQSYGIRRQPRTIGIRFPQDF